MSNPPHDFLWPQLKSLPAFRAVLRAIEARFYHQVDLPGPVLDVGCGDGNFAELVFNRYGRKLDVGIDPWWNPLRKSQRADIYHQVLQGFGDRMPFPDDTFGSAISNSVLEHIPDIQPVLNDTARVLKMGGKLVITMPNHQFTQYLGGAQLAEQRGWAGLADKYRTGFNTIARHAHTESVEWWADKLATAGMQVERWQYYFSPAALHALEIGHVQGLPSAVLHALTGQWLLSPTHTNLALVEQWLRPYYLEQAGPNDTCVFIVARKVARVAVQVQLPAARPFAVDEHGRLVPDEQPDPEPQPANAHPRPAAPDDAPAPAATAASTAVPNPTESHPPNPAPKLPTFTNAVRRQKWPLGFFFGGLILSFLAYTAANSGYSAVGVFLWMAAVVGGGFGLVGAPSVPQIFAWVGTTNRPRSTAWIMPAVLLVGGLVLRLYQLGEHPFLINGTSAALGQEAMRVVNGTWSNPFTTGTLNNPVLPLVGLGWAIDLFGRDAFGLRLPAALIGAMTIPAVYLLARRLWDQPTAVAGAILLAGSHVHLHYSRIGLTNIFDPLLVWLTVGFMVWGHRKSSRLIWLAAGATAGISAYFFTASRLLILLVPLTVGWMWLVDGRHRRQNLTHLAAAAGLCLLIGLPLMRHYTQTGSVFFDRFNQYSISRTNWLADEAQRTAQPRNSVLLTQMWHTLGAYTSTADRSPYYRADRPLLGWPMAVAFIVGVGWALLHLKKPQNMALPGWVALTAVFGGTLLIESPASHRYLVALPAACLLAALPVGHLVGWVSERWTVFQQSAIRVGAAAVLAAVLVAPDVGYYFGTYRAEPQLADRNTEIGHRVGEYLSSLDPDTAVYFLGAPVMFSDFPTIAFLAPQFRRGQNLVDVLDPAADLPAELDGAAVFVAVPERAQDLNSLADRYPHGTQQSFPGRYATPLFYVYAAVPPQE